MNSTSDAARSIFITGLKNAHALEAQATQIIGRQLDRLENYPEVAERLRLHLEETKQHQQRLEEILGSLNEDYSTIKDIAAGFMGNMAALGHTPAGDEILKNSFANLAFENYEIAAYTSLITVGEATGNASATRAFTPDAGRRRANGGVGERASARSDTAVPAAHWARC